MANVHTLINGEVQDNSEGPLSSQEPQPMVCAIKKATRKESDMLILYSPVETLPTAALVHGIMTSQSAHQSVEVPPILQSGVQVQPNSFKSGG